MSILARVRPTATPSHPYVDTPDFSYDGWLSHLQRHQRPIGTVQGEPSVAVIGAGASGTCVAYELARAGCHVTVFEADAIPGGRCASVPFTNNNPDLAELGAMRFPPSEFTLSHYLRQFGLVGQDGIAALPDFPDPGVVKTYISYEGEVSIWEKSMGHAPAGFDTVYNGWIAFNTHGITQDGQTVFQSPDTITKALASREVELATRYWQDYIHGFGQITFYTFLYDFYTGASGYDIPGGKAWSFEDF